MGGGARASSRSWRTSASPCIEIMPVAEFPGRFGWGYDGVDLFAPTRALRHARRLPALRRSRARARARRDPRRRLQPLRPGRQLPARSSRRHTSPTATRTSGARRINFDGPDAGPCASSFVANAGVLDRRVPPRRPAARRHAEHLRRVRPSTSSPRSARGARGGRAAATSIIVVAENEPQHARLVRPRRAAAASGSTPCGTTTSTTRRVVALTGRTRGLLHRLPRHAAGAHLGGEVGLSSTRASATAGRSKRRGHAGARRCPPTRSCTFLENHDQVANSARGRAAATSSPAPGRLRALTALLLLAPATPMLFQGQEFAAVAAVPVLRRSRARSSRAQVRAGTARVPGAVPEPDRPRRCRRALRRSRRRARRSRAAVLDLRRARARTRESWRCIATCCACGATTPFPARRAPAWRRRRRARREAFVLRFFAATPTADRSAAARQPRPDLAPAIRRRSRCSRRPRARVGGRVVERGSGATAAAGRRPSTRTTSWHLPGHAAIVLRPVRRRERSRCTRAAASDAARSASLHDWPARAPRSCRRMPGRARAADRSAC